MTSRFLSSRNILDETLNQVIEETTQDMSDEINAEAWYTKSGIIKKAMKPPDPVNRPSHPPGWGGTRGHNYPREPVNKPRNNNPGWGRGG